MDFIFLSFIVAVFLTHGFMHMRYGYLFHKHLCEKYPDKRYLTILDLKGEINGFKTMNNLFNDSEKELGDEYLTILKGKARMWLVLTMVSTFAAELLALCVGSIFFTN